jgi:hypothetical protein
MEQVIIIQQIHITLLEEAQANNDIVLPHMRELLSTFDSVKRNSVKALIQQGERMAQAAQIRRPLALTGQPKSCEGDISQLRGRYECSKCGWRGESYPQGDFQVIVKDRGLSNLIFDMGETHWPGQDGKFACLACTSSERSPLDYDGLLKHFKQHRFSEMNEAYYLRYVVLRNRNPQPRKSQPDWCEEWPSFRIG